MTIKMPMGLFRQTRIPYGIKMASVIFPRTMEQVIGDNIENVIFHQDVISIGARNEIELKRKLKLC